jgi:peptidoglycan/LPS O-acetylase OafA/YrhL
LREVVFLQNYGGGLWSHTWSLAVEEHFYILIPSILVLSLRLRRAPSTPFSFIPWAFAVTAVVCLCLRIRATWLYPYAHGVHVFPTHLRIDSLFAGVAISYLHHTHAAGFRRFADRFRPLLLAAGLALLTPPFLFELETSPFIYSFGLSLLWLGSGLILIALVDVEPAATRPVRALAYMGSRSYAIYLWHLPMAAWGIGIPMRLLADSFDWYVYAALYLAGSIALGIAMAAAVETPVIRLRDRWFPSRS